MEFSLKVRVAALVSTLAAGCGAPGSGQGTPSYGAAALLPQDTVTLERYPTIQAPARVAPNQEFRVEASLTREQLTPETGGAQTLVLRPRDRWVLDVDLHAQGFEIEGGNRRTITMTPTSDSTPACFHLRAAAGSTAPRKGNLTVMIWHEGAFVLSASRPIELAAAGDLTPSVVEGSGDLPVRVDLDAPAPDLTIFHWAGRVIAQSPHFVLPLSGEFAPEGDLFTELGKDLERLRVSGPSRGLAVRPAKVDPSAKNRAKNRAGAFGREAYERFAPDVFRTAYWGLVDADVQPPFRIQVFTDDPRIPWELMRPYRVERGETSAHGFLGLEHVVARAHLRKGFLHVGRSPGTLALDVVATIVPEYRYDPLRAAQKEKRAMGRLAKAIGCMRTVVGQALEVRELLADFPDGVIHYSGHGAVVDDEYYLVLEDESRIGVADLKAPSGAQGRPFLFLNACDVGASNAVAGWVGGWAPAALERGASGFLGAIWPVNDEAAARFSSAFYDYLAKRGEEGVSLAEAAREARRLYLDESQDNTSCLGYVYYGDVFLRAQRAR